MKVWDLIYQKRGFNHQNGNRQPMWDIYRGVKNFGNMYRYIYIIYIIMMIVQCHGRLPGGEPLKHSC